ncbi:3,4-dihydroxy-2-butanone-4-phosphate synthase [Prosthecomicrobium pneumaticum]|uniref:3,4-dihydroxy-2-butanone 4-phosphate synthase n=1 Tax=Prosthecomicrobium pneumaticum TaxID=81895 RepID=A0A7W9L260_9HYPH|nr:3,4-dihydroxy-2-butanone-4-phosphate synthase [Prosthecomicrobium pneumaticum]MBB5753290.1 3,4-dihydroxy 2-butanone 4-phosphate synthase/GTP cyclohydrolase II [Prosthecomicrobium pneumaticum]
MALDRVEDAIAAMAAGELVVVVDDTDRENEGDLIMAASKAAPDKIAFMIRHTSGIICVPMMPDRAETLNLAPMVANNRDPMRTAFTVTVDYRHGLTTGISAEERANTISALANDNCAASDFVRPGHIFPLIAREGGVLIRSGHTEAATDLARLAGLEPVGVLAEIVNDDGTVKRLPQLLEFAAEHGLKIISIEDLIAYRARTETFVREVDAFPVAIGGRTANAIVYETPFDSMQHLAIVFGDVREQSDIPTRIHRADPIADLIQNGSQAWLRTTWKRLGDADRGVFVLLRTPMIIRPDGLPEGTDGEERHRSAQSRRQRWREVGLGAQILRHLGVRSIRLLAAHERQFVGLQGFGIEIVKTEICSD